MPKIKTKRCITLISLGILISTLIPISSANAAWYEKDKILASDGEEQDLFGESIDIDGDFAIVGAWGEDTEGNSAGAAYIFKKEGSDWNQKTKLAPTELEASDLFGYSVSISGDYAIVGAYGDDDQANGGGTAYIFKRITDTNWSQVTKLYASDAADFDYFGRGVYIYGNYAIVGAPYDDDYGPSSNSGSAYIFEKDYPTADSWGQRKKIIAGDDYTGDRFGEDVSISDNYAVVGAHVKNSSAGAAYIFEKDYLGTNNWGQRKKLTADTPTSNDYFGFSVSTSGNYVIVGAYGDDDNGSGSGSAFVYYKDTGGTNNWGQQDKLLASDGDSSDQFGGAVYIEGDWAVVGALYDETSAEGSAYIFERSGTSWGEDDKIQASDGDPNKNFGNSVSKSGSNIMIGAYHDTENGSSAGAAYFFNQNSNAPTVTINSAVQKTDGSKAVDISVTVDDADDDDTVSLKVEYKLGSDCSSGTSDPTLDETDGNTTATYGDPKVENDNEYQVGNSSGWITTSSGANTVEFDWLSNLDEPEANGTYCIKITPYDQSDTGTPDTETLTVTNIDIPEFKDYIYILTILITILLTYKIYPKIILKK